MIKVERVLEEDCIFEIMEGLKEDFYSHKVDRNTLSKKISRHGNFHVCYVDSIVAGFIGYYANNALDRIGFLSTIVVAKEYQGEGIGRVLLQKCLADCRAKGMKKCRLEADRQNTGAIQFYTKHGFTKVEAASPCSDYYEREL